MVTVHWSPRRRVIGPLGLARRCSISQGNASGAAGGGLLPGGGTYGVIFSGVPTDTRPPPSTTTRSPGRSPSKMNRSLPFCPPSPTGRCSALLSLLTTQTKFDFPCCTARCGTRMLFGRDAPEGSAKLTVPRLGNSEPSASRALTRKRFSSGSRSSPRSTSARNRLCSFWEIEKLTQIGSICATYVSRLFDVDRYVSSCSFAKLDRPVNGALSVV